jgi:hypothetical protein
LQLDLTGRFRSQRLTGLEAEAHECAAYTFGLQEPP